MKNEINCWVDEHREELLVFLKEIIDTPSVNNFFAVNDDEKKSEEYHEKNCQKVVCKKLSELGFSVDMWEPDVNVLSKYKNRAGYHPERDYKDRPSLCGVLKGTDPTKGRSLMLLGHIDTVIEGSGWTKKAFDASIEDGIMYGRGSVDQKGGIAAMISAVEVLNRMGCKINGDVLVSTFCDEEAGGMGIMSVMDKGYRADAAIMTEPTNLLMAPMCRGILWGKLTVEGRSGHIEMYQGDFRTGGAVDAIDKAMLYIDAFRRLNDDWRITRTHPLLPNPCQIFVAQFNAGEFPTSFANKAEIIFNAQYRPCDRDENLLGGKVKQEILDLINNVAMTDPWLKEHVPHVEWLMDADCAETSADHEFVKCMSNAAAEAGFTGEVGGLGFHTDMGWPVNSGIPVINYGPGRPEVSHRSDEGLPVEDYFTSIKVMASTIVDWCGIRRDEQ